METIKFKCDECEEKVSENKFYRIITEKLNPKVGEYEPYRICKECLIKDWSFGITDIDDSLKIKDKIHYMCKKYNLYYSDSVVDSAISESLTENNSENHYKEFSTYLRIISSLRQYNGLKFKDSIYINDNAKPIEQESKEKSDIDFINDDIKGVKYHIEYSLKQHNVNEHNKWLNSLRDAFLLRERLESTIKPTYDLYFDASRDSNDLTIIYYKNDIYYLRNKNIYEIANNIKNIILDDEVKIYGNISNVGLMLADELKQLGLKVEPINIRTFDEKTGWVCREQNYDRLS
jgi:hypothetical protein